MSDWLGQGGQNGDTEGVVEKACGGDGYNSARISRDL